MRYLLLFLGLTWLVGCGDNRANTGQRLDFVGTTRLTSSNRTGLGPADTVASRVYGVAADNELLTRLRITVKYTPRRSPFVYPTPISALVRDSIDNNPDPDFIYLDTLIDQRTDFLFTSVFGVRTTAGSERWQYELRDASGNVKASRAFRLSTRRPDSLLTYQDYTLKLPVPANGAAARSYLHLRAGLALPTYTVLGNTNATTGPSQMQAAIQDSTDLIVLPDGLTLVAPNAPAPITIRGLTTTNWPLSNRRDTNIYLASGQTASTFVNQITDGAIANIYASAAAGATTTGKIIGPVSTGQVYAFRTDKGMGSSRRYRYGLLLVVSIPTSTATTNTAGLQLEVRMAK